MNRESVVEKSKALLVKDLGSEGFDDVGIVTAGNSADQSVRLQAFLSKSYHGSMDWLEETANRRSHPKQIWDDVQTIVMVAMNYGPDKDYQPLQALNKPGSATISCYAHHRDYHDVMKGKLKQVAGRFAARSGAQVKVFVDTAPVMEKPLAQGAGVGWQGKHTNLVSQKLGSWFFLGAIFTDMDLPADHNETDHCGSCRSCLDICPTNAFPAPYKLDARRCISYLTIEHAGPINIEFRKPMGNRVYGCDDCLAVCPWNKFASVAKEAKLAGRDAMKSPPLSDLLKLEDAEFRSYFSGSPIKRIGRNRFIRNCLIAAGNSGDCGLVDDVNAHLVDVDPVIRGASVWALSQLVSIEKLRMDYNENFTTEKDRDVQDEWALALGTSEVR